MPNKADETGYAAPASIDPDRVNKFGKVAALAQNLSEILEHIFIVTVFDPVVRNINEDRAEKALLGNACPPTTNKRACFECNEVMGQLVEYGTLDIVGKSKKASRATIGELGHDEVPIWRDGHLWIPLNGVRQRIPGDLKVSVRYLSSGDAKSLL